MKNNIMQLKYLVFVITIFLLYSCSSDDDNKIYLPPLGEKAEANELRLVFSPTPDQYELRLDIDVSIADNSKSELLVNWGDDNMLHPINSDWFSYNMTHTYEDIDRDYTVSIRTGEGVALAGIDITEPEVATRIKSIQIGEAPSLEKLNIHTYDNILEQFDLSANPQFYENYFKIDVNTPYFNFEDFKLFKRLNFNITVPRPAHFENMTADYLWVFYSLEANIQIPEVSIKNSNITEVNIMGYLPGNTVYINNIDLSGLNTEKLSFQCTVINDLDLSKMKRCEMLKGWYFDCQGKIYFSETHTNIFMNGGFRYDFNYLEEIDVRNCKDLAYLNISSYTNLKEAKYNMTDKLKSVWIQQCPHIDDVFYDADEEVTRLGTKADVEQRADIKRNLDSDNHILRLTATR